jgi:hypothetical protein
LRFLSFSQYNLQSERNEPEAGQEGAAVENGRMRQVFF